MCLARATRKKRPTVTRYGVIGTREGVERFRRFSAKMRGYIPVPVPGSRSRKIEPQHVPFPGFQEAFNSEWPEKPAAVVQDIQLQEIEDTMRRPVYDRMITQLELSRIASLQSSSAPSASPFSLTQVSHSTTGGDIPNRNGWLPGLSFEL